jgi:hypothetical protein
MLLMCKMVGTFARFMDRAVLDTVVELDDALSSVLDTTDLDGQGDEQSQCTASLAKQGDSYDTLPRQANEGTTHVIYPPFLKEELSHETQPVMEKPNFQRDHFARWLKRQKYLFATIPPTWLHTITDLDLRIKAENNTDRFSFELQKSGAIKFRVEGAEGTKHSQTITMHEALDVATVWWRLGYHYQKEPDW